ncbi:bifunctional folylpolyglutamate synthase/dihydrofolate synthase [Limimaricola hongkongensis]|uniref:Dihydrofolate synthase/folylpolyglutamate synthase n=1 Tax=Limimaricola hongkongensis DSM 17492 TaxID=1122180 RepID=A0A017HHR4_9RHOB|nr:folylpolyglutamate synthase/dihydrofolate synthase family protein [Limimaricola hongkongensis]EYD73334.1 Dihydrofolate synthase / Folylpolyglutamate synthase [Limimaricola hongkongensis DSM 17492]
MTPAPGSDAILARMMSLHPKVIDLTLDRVWRLLAALDHPERRLPPVIHLAGTNGKGSTQAMIRAGLEASGDRVHAYTSPHLARFHERIRLAGELISEEALTKLLDRTHAANGPDSITYFEITTAAALLAFAETPAEWTLLETGLGGRLDATNVVERPALTVITPIDLDHQQYLGETIEEIAGEKAGILKRGVPCVVAPQHEAALEVIEAKAARLGVPLMAHGQHWHVTTEAGRLVYQDERGLLDLPLPRLRGPHQIVNAGTAIASLRALGRNEAAAEAALRADWPARMQRLSRGPLVDLAGGAELWLDGGHNPAAGAALARSLRDMPGRPAQLICGMLNTKDIAGYLRPLAQVAQGLHAVSIPGEANTIPAADTAHAARAAGFDPVAEADDVAQAVRDITARDPAARILICGSLYLAGQVLRDNG